MPKILCTLPNASELIGGVRFVTHADGMISEEVSAEVAERFLSIPGYCTAGSAAAAEKAEAEAKAVAYAAAAAAVVEKAAVEAKAAASAAPAASANPAADATDTGAESVSIDIDALRAEATGLGIDVNKRWGEARLKAEIDAKKAEPTDSGEEQF